MSEYTAKDFKKGQPRWCPGCGDHFFLASLHKAMAEIGVAPWDTAVISGIGCSSRLPHYMNTYGMNTIARSCCRYRDRVQSRQSQTNRMAGKR